MAGSEIENGTEGLVIEELAFLDWEPVSVSVAPGECVGIRGPSGSGKSLFLRAVADLDVHRGKTSLAGASSSAMSGPEWRNAVGLLAAESPWWAESVGEHFPKKRKRARFLVSELGFDSGEVFDWDTGRLSSGERQRLALARLLARHPKALLLDEPTANLEEESTSRVEAVVRSYQENEKVPILWVSHDQAQLERIADRVFRFEEKRWVEA